MDIKSVINRPYIQRVGKLRDTALQPFPSPRRIFNTPASPGESAPGPARFSAR